MKHLLLLLLTVTMLNETAWSQNVVSADQAEKSKDDKLIHVGLVITTPPRSYYENSDPNQPLIGYEPDILNEIGKRIGKEIVYYDVAWAGLFTGLLAQLWPL